MEHGVWIRSTTAAFVYMPHSAVVSCFESPILRPKGRMMAGDVSDPPPPPKNRGVAHVLIYPCGKAWNRPPFPSRFIVADRSSPSRVRFAASRPGRLRADPKDALLTRGKGGSGRGARGRVASPLVHDKGYYHSCLGRSRKLAFGHTRRLSRSRGALSPAGP